MSDREPEYLSADDPFGDNDLSWSKPQNDKEQLMLFVTGRSRFQTQEQAAKVRSILRRYEDGYIRTMCTWAERKNSGTRLVIKLDTLIRTIRNPDHYKKYLEKRQDPDDRSGYGEPNH